jgi:hypothetical protein
VQPGEESSTKVAPAFITQNERGGRGTGQKVPSLADGLPWDSLPKYTRLKGKRLFLRGGSSRAECCCQGTLFEFGKDPQHMSARKGPGPAAFAREYIRELTCMIRGKFCVVHEGVPVPTSNRLSM